MFVVWKVWYVLENVGRIEIGDMKGYMALILETAREYMLQPMT